MNKIFFIMKRELGTYFNSAVAYIVVVLFLAITGSLFWLNYFQEISHLSMRGFFDQAPLFLAFFAPAITMGLFATEKRSGTLELLMTMPVSDFQIVMGKFLAALLLLAVVFAMTLPYPYTLSILGDLDWGAVFAGHIGLLLLGGAYAAIGLMASSWSRDQVVSILVAFSLCFFLYIVDQLAGQPTGLAAQAVEYLSTNTHFQNIARGVLDMRDIVYYLSVIGVALVAATLSIGARRWDKAKLSNNATALAVGLLTVVIAVVLNAAFSQVFWRYDMTANKIYTLSQASVSVVEELDEPVEARVFISPDLPPPFHNLAQQVDELLMEYEAASDGRFSYRIHSPGDDEDVEELARGYGIEKVAIGQETETSVSYRAIYKGVAFVQGEEVEVIEDLLVSGRPELDNFEYEFTRALLNLVREEPQKVAFLAGAGGPAHSADFAEAVAPFFKRFYGDLLEVESVDVSQGGLVDEDITALIALNIDRDVGEEGLFAIDQFLQRGGNMGWFQSGSVIDEELFMQLAQEMQAQGIEQPMPRVRKPLETDLVGYFESLGLELRADGVIDRDKALSFGMVMTEHGPVHVSHPATFWIDDINRELSFTRQFSTLALPLPATIVADAAAAGEEVEIFEVLRTGETSRRLAELPALVSYEELIEVKPGESQGPFVVAAAMQGELRSYYEDEPIPAGRSEAELTRESQPSRVLIVGSGDFLGEDPDLGFDRRLSALGMQFFLNSVEWLAQESDLSEIRGKAMPQMLPMIPKEVQRSIQFVNIAGVPAFFLSIGAVMMVRRRKRKEAFERLAETQGEGT